MSVVKPIGLLTNHLTGSPPVIKVVENPASGMGQEGKSPTGVIEVIGPSVDPITMVLVTQSLSSAPNSQSPVLPQIKTTIPSNVPCKIPLFASFIPGELTENLLLGKHHLFSILMIQNH